MKGAINLHILYSVQNVNTYPPICTVTVNAYCTLYNIYIFYITNYYWHFILNTVYCNFDLKGQCHEKSFKTETVGWGGRLGTKGVANPNFMFLRCPFNLQRIFQDGIHRSKIEFMVGPGSDVNLTSEPPMVRKFAIHEHASHSQFSNHPGSGKFNIRVWQHSSYRII